MVKHRQPGLVTLPVTSEALRFARRVSAPLVPLAIADRVFNNAIAVFTVHQFLELVNIPSCYENSALWSPPVQVTADLSDLILPDLGLLECRWMPSDMEVVSLPSESQGDRIGYAFVSCDWAARQATLHGFVPQVTQNPIPRDAFLSIEFMLQYFEALNVPHVSITRWLSGRFEAGWEPIEAFVCQSPPFAFRGLSLASTSPQFASQTGDYIRRAKTLYWGVESPQFSKLRSPVILVLEVSQTALMSVHISIQIHPFGDQQYLQPDLMLAILDRSGAEMMQATARSIDNYLQLQLKGAPGEIFHVQVLLNQDSMMETFQI